MDLCIKVEKGTSATIVLKGLLTKIRIVYTS